MRPCCLVGHVTFPSKNVCPGLPQHVNTPAAFNQLHANTHRQQCRALSRDGVALVATCKHYQARLRHGLHTRLRRAHLNCSQEASSAYSTHGCMHQGKQGGRSCAAALTCSTCSTTAAAIRTALPAEQRNRAAAWSGMAAATVHAQVQPAQDWQQQSDVVCTLAAFKAIKRAPRSSWMLMPLCPPSRPFTSTLTPAGGWSGDISSR